MAKVTLMGNPISTNGELPKKGSAAPDFQLVDKDLKNRSLKEFSANRILLSIVPSLDTATCSIMAKKFNEAVKGKSDVNVLLISADLPFAQKRFCSSEKADNIIPLSMMRNKDFARDYGVLIQDGPLAGICARAVVILDKDHKVIYSELVPEISTEPDYEKALSFLFAK